MPRQHKAGRGIEGAAAKAGEKVFGRKAKARVGYTRALGGTAPRMGKFWCVCRTLSSGKYGSDNSERQRTKIISDVLDVGKKSPYYLGMGKLYSVANWFIRVQGLEHPPVHVHVVHPDGKAVIDLDGTITNSGVPAAVIGLATEWVQANEEAIRAEWVRMNNPAER